MRISDWSSDVCSSDLKARREQHADLVERGIAAAVGHGLRVFAEHHQFRQRRHPAGAPALPAIADRLDQCGIEMKRPALVAARPEERRVGKECVSTWRPPGYLYP